MVQSTDTSGASTTNTGFVDFSGLDTTYTPNLQEYVVVLANAVMGSSSEVAVAELRDDTAGVSYRIDSGEAENNNGFSPDRDQQPTLVVHAEQISSSTTWKLRFREALSGTAVIGRNPDNTTGIRSDLIVWGLSLPGPGKNDTAWSNFGYGLDPTDIVNRVEAGVEWFRTSQRPILNLSVSWDGGSTWAPNLTATNKSSDDDSVEWLDFSAATAWDASKLSDANFMVRVATNFSGARLDHVAVRINWVGSPNLDFLVTASTSTIQPGQTSVLRVEFTNSGQGPAEDIWVNVSFPAELSYVGDDAESIGGVLTGAYSYEFSSVTPGDYSFNITASAMGGTPNGTLVVTNFTFEATDHRGVPFIQTGQDVTITIVSGVIDLSLVSSMDDVDPGDTLTHNLMVRNVGSGIVQRLLIETFIDPNVTYISSSPMGNYSPVQRALNWTVAALDAGDTTSFEWSMVVNVGTPDLTVLVSPARVHYEDSNGTRLEAGPVAVPSTVRVASFSPQLDSDASTAERGDEVDITLYYNNTGTGTALRAWANWSLGGDYRLVSLTPTASYEVTAGGFSVVLDSVTPGDHSLVARLEVTRGMVDGLDLGLTVSWKATDGNGNPISEESLPTAMELLAPEVTLTLVSSKASVESGSILRLNVTIYNSGGAPATGWLNLTLPPGVEFVDTNASFDMSSTDGLLSWAVPNLPERSSTHIGVQLKLSGDPRTVSLRFAMDFTEGKGSPAESSMSDPVLVEVVSTGIDITSWPWWLWTLIVTMSVGTFAVAMRFRGGKVHVEEVFVIDPAGTLLAHRSSTILQHKDEDLVAAMFTAIQSYVKDVFSGGMDEEMRLLEFGERKILMEGGRHHHVAVIYRGRDSGGLAKRLHEVSQRIDEKFGDILADWDGTMDKVHGISMLLPRVWKGAR